jgi:hypothetical protein
VTRYFSALLVSGAAMKFSQRDWVTEIAGGTMAGLLGGLAWAFFVPDFPFLESVLGGGVTAFVISAVNQPLRWLLERRPKTGDGGSDE